MSVSKISARDLWVLLLIVAKTIRNNFLLSGAVQELSLKFKEKIRYNDCQFPETAQ